MSRLYFYKLVSPYESDVTKNCKLSINEIDSNFLELKNDDIKSAEFIREEKVIVLTRNNGEKLIVDLSDATYDLNVSKECGESGVTLSVSYDGKDGEKSLTIQNIVTAENVEELVKRTEKVITDGTLKGIGNITFPLGIKEIEKTGMYRPADDYIDLTSGGTLPPIAKYGTTYVTKEYVSEYGYLYNFNAVSKISESLGDSEWRIPTKADFDALLNSIEPCEYRNHNSASCHVELGKYAGKFLKSECGWIGQSECKCDMTKPVTSTTEGQDGYISDDTVSADEPTDAPFSPSGIDKYGFAILPSGMGALDAYERPISSHFKEKGFFWTTSHIYDDPKQDIYVKIFGYNKGGVIQEARCSSGYYSIRLVKDFDGSNYRDVEYINGIPYKTILNADTSQIWLASNFNGVEGLIGYEEGGETPDYVEVNNGEINEKRKEIFLNIWNGVCWEKKLLREGDTIVVQNPCFGDGKMEYTWIDSEGVEHVFDVPEQFDKEYRVYIEDESCNKVLVNTDDLVVERVLNVILPILEQETIERKAADEVLSGVIDTEIADRIAADDEIKELLSAETAAREAADEGLSAAISAETEARESADTEIWDAISAITSGQAEIWEALSAETAAREAADEELSAAISAETENRKASDDILEDAIDSEVERAISAETILQEEIDVIDGQLIDSTQEYTIKVVDGVKLMLKNGNVINIGFDGNFGMI